MNVGYKQQQLEDAWFSIKLLSVLKIPQFQKSWIEAETSTVCLHKTF